MSLTPQQEAQLRAAALASERRNRPFLRVAIAVAVLAASGVFAAWSLAAAERTRGVLASDRERLAEAQTLVEQIRQIRNDPRRSANNERYAPETRLRSKLDRISERLDMEQTPSIRDAGAKQLGVGSDSPLEKRSVEVRMSNVPLETALEWVNEAVREIPGLHVTGVELRPNRARGWSIHVQLSRWEFRQ